jgi:hypothetical protein
MRVKLSQQEGDALWGATLGEEIILDANSTYKKLTDPHWFLYQDHKDGFAIIPEEYITKPSKSMYE